MQGFSTRTQKVYVGGLSYRLRMLSDKQQFSDPGGYARRLGISSAQWCLFGQVWPSGRLLAQAMLQVDIAGRRILELGCGIGLASLVLQRRGANIVASDMHPLTESFLAYNAALNALPALQYRTLRWDTPVPSLGRFDLIIASDVLYEPDQARLLAGVMDRHAYPRAEILLTDPGRAHSGHFNRLLTAQGFVVEEARCPMDDQDVPPYRGHLLRYRR